MFHLALRLLLYLMLNFPYCIITELLRARDQKAVDLKTEKRGKLELVTFPCMRKSEAVCNNGGRGPRVMRKGKGAMCACMCPFGYGESKCEKSWWHQ